ncbi:MAG: hypothetical protein GY839_14060 [candidate division Zixibacteria bacterium]|nr:hypothetical protein [candidate division Zixibacteria bacterium]
MKKGIFWFLSIMIVINMQFVIIHAAPPADPTLLKAVPVYTDDDMKLTWEDNSGNEDGFKIERKTGSGAFGQITTVGVGAETYTDNTTAANTEYTYRVRAYNSDGNSGYSNESSNEIAITWALSNGGHEMMNGWQDGTPGNNWGFHEGVDVQDDGDGGQTVVACRGGIIKRKDSGYAGGHLAIEILDGTNTFYDRFLHGNITTSKAEGEVVSPGETVAEISTTAYSAGARHLHQVILDSWTGTNGYAADGSNFNNPLPMFETNADKDPLGNTPSLEDIDGDGHDILYKRPDNSYITNGKIYGDVDISVEMVDNMGTDPRENPHRVGYWIDDGTGSTSNDVKSAASPYLLHDFDNWFGQSGSSANFDDIYDPAKSYTAGTGFTKRAHHIVTNTQGTNGSVANLDASEFWKTDARQGSGTESNGSDAQKARENQEAKFPDRTYFVHVLLEDLIHSTDRVRSVVVDNSRPYVKKATVYSGLRIVYMAEWVWDGTSALLSIQPSTFDAAAAFTALRTQDITVEVEFSEPMQTASINSVSPLGVTPTLSSTQFEHERTVWTGIISNIDIADDGSDDGTHMITFAGTDLNGNQLLQINNRNDMGANHHNRDATGNMLGSSGQDNIHGFKIGPLTGVIPITAIFMKQTSSDPTTPPIAEKSLSLQNALNDYFDEVSYSTISFTVTGHGWYQLDQTLGWYYTDPQTPLIDLVQEAINDAETDGVDISSSNYIMVVTDENTDRTEWSTNGGWPYSVAAAPGWQLFASATINLASTDAHVTNAFGRIVGLIDLFAYPYVSYPRPFVGPWSHMSDKDTQVHVLGWEKWRAGWLDETGDATGNTLTRVPKPSSSSPIVNQSHTITRMDVDNDDVKMVAVDIGDRLHYTAEYRRRHNLDQDLPNNPGVLITKVNDYINQGEGPAIVQEAPVTIGDLDDAPFNTNAATDEFDDVGSGVNILVNSMNANEADIVLNYEIPPHENDVWVSPWDSRAKAVDIWVDAPDLSDNYDPDPLSLIDADEKPVPGKPNKIFGRIRNQGRADASNFEVYLAVREPWGAGGPWDTLVVKTITHLEGQDMDPNAFDTISVFWNFDAGVHTCVMLEVSGVANDINTGNNWTQENISEFETTSGSPYAPVTSRFGVGNPHDYQILAFFKLDGLPPSWSYIISPDRLVIPAGGEEEAIVTIQPHDGAPVCSREDITISAYTPQVDALQKLGAITLQVALKNDANIALESWLDCDKNEYRDDQDSSYTTGAMLKAQTHSRRCAIFTRGCTDPILANTQIAVIYTAPNGSKQVHYVTTDENGCYMDMLTVGEPGAWQTQAVLVETDCRVEAKTDERPVYVGPIPGLGGKLSNFICFGPNFPLGDFNDVYDPGFSLNAGAEYSFVQNFTGVLILGFHQFYSPIRNEHFNQLSLNLKHRYLNLTDRYAYIQAGGGLYKPRSGGNSAGANFGMGLTWILTPQLGLDLQLNYHLVSFSQDHFERADFIAVQMGAVWSH